MKPRIAGFELYIEDLESALRSQFGASPFLCLERKGAESYPSRDKAVVFVEVPDLQAAVARLGERILQFEPGSPGRQAWALLHDPEGHNVLLLQSSGG